MSMDLTHESLHHEATILTVLQNCGFAIDFGTIYTFTEWLFVRHQQSAKVRSTHYLHDTNRFGA